MGPPANANEVSAIPRTAEFVAGRLPSLGAWSHLLAVDAAPAPSQTWSLTVLPSGIYTDPLSINEPAFDPTDP